MILNECPSFIDYVGFIKKNPCKIQLIPNIQNVITIKYINIIM